MLIKKSTAYIRYRRIGGQVQMRLGTAQGLSHQRLPESPEKRLLPISVFVAKARTHYARMEGIRYDPLFAASQFAGEQHHRQFALGVGFNAIVRSGALLPSQIIKVDLTVALRYR